jgi:hypothetical protein
MARRGSLLRRAADETTLRYGPEARGLHQLMRELRSDLRVSIKAEEGAAAGIKQAIQHVRPQVHRVYQGAGLSFEQADADLAAAGAVSNASQREAAAAKRRLAESFADADTELSQRTVDAEAGRAYGVRQAKAEYRSGVGKVRGQQRDLEREAGLYASTTFRDLQDAEAKLNLERQRVNISRGNLRVSRRRAGETERHNREQEANARAEERRLRAKQRRDAREEASGKNKWTPTQRQDALAQWDKAKVLARTLKANDDTKKLSPQKWVEGLVRKGIDPILARGAVQFVRTGGVSGPVARRIRRNYPLAPHVKTDLERSADILTGLGM